MRKRGEGEGGEREKKNKEERGRRVRGERRKSEKRKRIIERGDIFNAVHIKKILIYKFYWDTILYICKCNALHTCTCRVLASKCSKGVGIHTLLMKYLNKQDYEAFSRFYK